MKCLVLPLLFFALFSSLPIAAGMNTSMGRVVFTIINEPPEITNISILPEPLYSDGIATCTPIIHDERPAEAHLLYLWRVNGRRAPEQTATFIGFKEGDTIECIALAVDKEGLPGNQKTAQAIVQAPPASVKMTKALLNTFGGNVDYTEAARLEKEGTGAITAYVVYEGVGEKNILAILVVLLFLVGLLLGTIVLRHRIRAKS